jgi:hypothetical protein
MILIAHRALFNGYDEARENHPDQIRLALAEGFDVETDVRFIDGEWWLGHDAPTHKVDQEFVFTPKLWLHCKNAEALHQLCTIGDQSINYFWHQNDDYTLTSKGWIWTYPGLPLYANCIRNQPEWVKGWFDDPTVFRTDSYAGVCSKFVGQIRRALAEG